MSEERVTTVRRAASSDDMDRARSLFGEYQASLAIDLCFQGFDHELATLPGVYAPPEGALLLATVDASLAGCCAMRPLPVTHPNGRTRPGVCEMKRLFVRPAFRGLGVGRRLVSAILSEARHAGYQTMVLDTLSDMVAARALYEEAGFAEVDAYYDNPIPSALYFEADLA